jgi:hypothetical protein
VSEAALRGGFFVCIYTININKYMILNMWYCDGMGLWRWTLTDNRLPIIKQKTGQGKELKSVLKDIQNSIESIQG